MKFIYTLEVCGLCNLKCAYCPHPVSPRELGLMSREVFYKALELIRATGQDYICLHNFGEPLMHPEIVDYVRIARKTVSNVVFSTNGILLTRELAVQLKEAGLTELYISTHSPEDAQRAIENCDDLDLLKQVRSKFRHDWAGSAKKHPTRYKKVPAAKQPCVFHRDGWVVVLWDGTINSCCIDMHAEGRLGTIWDEDALSLWAKDFSLCDNCDLMRDASGVISPGAG